MLFRANESSFYSHALHVHLKQRASENNVSLCVRERGKKKKRHHFRNCAFLLVERSIELSNLIWEGLEEFERLDLGYLETFKVLEK